jgi:hypothetical protein
VPAESAEWTVSTPQLAWSAMTADITISSYSTEYVQVPVQAVVAGAPYNPTTDTVAVQFVPQGGQQEPTGTWNTGSWVTTAQSTYLAQCLVGPEDSGVVLTPATYVIWLKITDNPEIPVIPAGTVTIT